MPYKIRKFTESEKKEQILNSLTKIKVKDTTLYFLDCDKCSLAFIGEDEILISESGIGYCPICFNRMYGCTEEYFKDNYKILEE